MVSEKMWFEFSPIFVGCIFSIPFPEAYFVSSYFVNNILSQVDKLLVGVGVDICGINIYQFLNIVENSIDCCVDIKSRIFDHIIKIGKHLRCDFSIGIKDILEDAIDGLLGGVNI